LTGKEALDWGADEYKKFANRPLKKDIVAFCTELEIVIAVLESNHGLI
jgi:hypothetical protein